MVRPSPFHVLAFVACLTAPWDSPADAAGLLVPRDGSAPIQLQSHRVTVTIDDGLARTTVRQTFINPHRRALEAIYVFPVPEQAALVDLVMEAGGQRLEGLLAERRAARSAYDAIVRKGKDPALLEQIGRSTFRLSVFPVLPDQETMVELTWIEVVPLQAGEYRYVYPLALAGSLTSTERDLTLDVTVRSSAPMVSVSSPSSAMATALVSPHEARASFERSRATLDQDLTVVAKVSAQEPSLGARVFKNPGGDAFFAAVITPPDLTPDRMLPRDVTLALDVSGSMQGAKLDQARSAAIQMITDLRETDRANVILFNSFLRRFREEPVPMTAENRRDALRFVADATATGGTALGDVIEAISQAPTTRGRPSIAVVLTDGLPSVGKTDPGDIVRAARVAGNRSMQVWTFGVGHDVDAALLDGVAAATGARCEIFRDKEEIEPRLRAFSARTASPAIADLRLTVGGRVVDGALPHPLGVAYLGEQVVITGRVPGSG